MENILSFRRNRFCLKISSVYDILRVKELGNVWKSLLNELFANEFAHDNSKGKITMELLSSRDANKRK